MRAGSMRHRLAIQESTEKRNDFGEPLNVWSTVKEVSAAIDQNRGTETYEAERMVGEAVWKIRLRDDPDIRIDPSMRGLDVDTGAVYQFDMVERNHVRSEIFITATSGAKVS